MLCKLKKKKYLIGVILKQIAIIITFQKKRERYVIETREWKIEIGKMLILYI